MTRTLRHAVGTLAVAVTLLTGTVGRPEVGE
jgi:hypothetical protein